MIDLFEKALADREAEIDYAKNEGIREGIEEAREEYMAETVKRLANMGMDVDFIAKACNFTEKEVMRIISTK
jgi:predicted transposase/invertase (TIGR01784 family)